MSTTVDAPNKEGASVAGGAATTQAPHVPKVRANGGQANGSPNGHENGGFRKQQSNGNGGKPRSPQSQPNEASNGHQGNQGKQGQSKPRTPGQKPQNGGGNKGLTPEQFSCFTAAKVILQQSGVKALDDDIIHVLKQNNFDSTVAAQKIKDSRQNTWSSLVTKNIKTKPEVETSVLQKSAAPTQQSQRPPRQPKTQQPKEAAVAEPTESAEQRLARTLTVSEKLAELKTQHENMISHTSEFGQLQTEMATLDARKVELKAETDRVNGRLGQIQQRLVELRKKEDALLKTIKETSLQIANNL
jgi:hypothetical protein